MTKKRLSPTNFYDKITFYVNKGKSMTGTQYERPKWFDFQEVFFIKSFLNRDLLNPSSSIW